MNELTFHVEPGDGHEVRIIETPVAEDPWFWQLWNLAGWIAFQSDHGFATEEEARADLAEHLR